MVEFLDLGLPLLVFLAGAGLVVMEAIIPGAHFIVVGVALLLAGLLGFLLPGILGGPVALAVMVAVFAVGTFLAYREIGLYGGDSAAKTSDSASLRGQTGTVTERVTTADGQVKLDKGGFNPHYAARSVDGTIEEGEEVIVVDPGGGNVLTVESAAGPEMDEIDRELAQDRSRSRDAESTGTETETETEPN